MFFVGFFQVVRDGTVLFIECEPSEACSNGLCTEGYQSNICGECAPVSGDYLNKYCRG